MTPIVQEHFEEMKALCRKYHVAEPSCLVRQQT